MKKRATPVDDFDMIEESVAYTNKHLSALAGAVITDLRDESYLDY
jgi:hypothetical protein